MVATATLTPAQEAGRPQPQTTIEAPGGPFIRHSQAGKIAQWVQSNLSLSALVAPPLVSAPGYARAMRLRFSASGGTSTTAVVPAADAPFNTVALVTLFDAFGTPLIVAPGYEALYLIPKYGGCYGLGAAADIKSMPSYSP